MLTLLKYSTPECPVCRTMATFDARVAEELAVAYVVVDLTSPEIYRRYRGILLQKYPLKRELKLPTYLLVDDPEGDFTIHGDISGGLPEDLFRSRLEALVATASQAD
ncbi:thioredoxin family protein [Cyanobium sp. CH-040]|uniref:thioredoxin family protein n=1 Tax=Cyanobium sp. CH-040 TaxID=2823708 RepID=UPI0020CC2B87|nr:thioredoxin family protein [Cyanobium sp. CH-040]MCP9927744.1 thioredoxin family protein [Cyanobium sp. CH-040]